MKKSDPVHNLVAHPDGLLPIPGTFDVCGTFDYPLIQKVTVEIRDNDNNPLLPSGTGAVKDAVLDTASKYFRTTFTGIPDSPTSPTVKKHRLIARFYETGGFLNAQQTVFIEVKSGATYTSRCPAIHNGNGGTKTSSAVGKRK